jgi:hypothetical protein
MKTIDNRQFLIISRSVLLRIRNVPDKIARVQDIKLYVCRTSNCTCAGHQNTFYDQKLFFENRVVYKIMWKNVVERDSLQTTVWRMRIVCWVTKATNTHSQYVILVAFPLQERLPERPCTLRYAALPVLLTPVNDALVFLPSYHVLRCCNIYFLRSHYSKVIKNMTSHYLIFKVTSVNACMRRIHKITYSNI